MSNRPTFCYETEDGHRTRAPPEQAIRTVDGEKFVWIRTRDGDVTRAFEVGAVV